MLISKLTRLYFSFPYKKANILISQFSIFKGSKKDKQPEKQIQRADQKQKYIQTKNQLKQSYNKLQQFPFVDLSMSTQTKKQMDLDLSNFYKEILERERIRMQSNQRRVQQLLNQQKARADRKQQQVRDQIKQFLSSLRAMIGIGGILGLIYYFFTVINQGGDAVQKIKKFWGDWSFQQEQKLPKYYLQQNSIEKELAKIQFDGIIGLSYIIGAPGSGKTTALKNVVNKLRNNIKENINKKWSKIYYINLRVDDENGKVLLQKTRQRIQQMSNLLKSIFLDPLNYERALIIIDDIQMFEKVLSENQAKQKLQSILFKCQMQSCKFVVVSSSSYSCYKALTNANFRRSAYITEVQNLTLQQLKKIIDNRVKYEKEVKQLDIPKQVVNYIQGYDSIRGVMQSLGLVVNQIRINKQKQKQVYVQKLLQKLRDYDSYRIWDMKLEMIKMLRQYSQTLGSKEVAYILESILNLPAQFKLGDKYSIINQVVQKFPRLRNHLDEIANVIDELDKRNLLIFGHPRSKLQRQALKQVFSGLA